MRRRELLTLLGRASAFAACWPLPLHAQPSGKLWQIGVLDTESATLNTANIAAFRQGLLERGYVEGRNLTIDYRSADGRNERFPELADELLRRGVDLIVTKGTPAVLAARKASASIPIVMAANADPLLVVASLAHPGGNITGLSTLSSDLHPKRLGLLREIVPGIARIALLTNLSNPQTRPQWEEIEAAARSLGMEAELLDVRKPGEIAPAFSTATAHRVGALVVGTDGLMQANRELITALAAEHRLPTMYGIGEFVVAGGLIAYGPSYPDLYRRAATYVDRIFKGTSPADLPIEQPTKFELIINLKAAQSLGLTVPITLQAAADEVIE
jgi:putative ABC transport system substrate-binding protein